MRKVIVFSTDIVIKRILHKFIFYILQYIYQPFFNSSLQHEIKLRLIKDNVHGERGFCITFTWLYTRCEFS